MRRSFCSDEGTDKQLAIHEINRKIQNGWLWFGTLFDIIVNRKEREVKLLIQKQCKPSLFISSDTECGSEKKAA